jgi:hypothetical protein
MQSRTQEVPTLNAANGSVIFFNGLLRHSHMSHALRSGPVPAERKCCDPGQVGDSGFVKNFTAAIASPSGPGPVVKPISWRMVGTWSGGRRRKKLRTLREVISADRIARSRSDPVFVLHVPAARIGGRQPGPRFGRSSFPPSERRSSAALVKNRPQTSNEMLQSCLLCRL